jgi:hypothetical protein
MHDFEQKSPSSVMAADVLPSGDQGDFRRRHETCSSLNITRSFQAERSVQAPISQIG